MHIQDLFKIHPKGTGVVCTAPEGLPPHVVICPYYGTNTMTLRMYSCIILRSVVLYQCSYSIADIRYRYNYITGIYILGEVYPPYRWCEKNDVVEQAQKKFNLKPTLPDFYNILLERPRQDPNGYGKQSVDDVRRVRRM